MFSSFFLLWARFFFAQALPPPFLCQQEERMYMNFVEPIRDPETVRDIADYLGDINEKYRVMFYVGVYSGLRISDILELRIRDVKDKTSVTVRERKTGKEKIFPINPALAKILKPYCEGKGPWDFLVPSEQRRGSGHIERRWAWKVMHEAGKKFGMDHLGTHTLRKTFGYHFYMQTKDVVLLQKILNHNHPSETLRYIGIERDTMIKAMSKFRI